MENFISEIEKINTDWLLAASGYDFLETLFSRLDQIRKDTDLQDSIGLSINSITDFARTSVYVSFNKLLDRNKKSVSIRKILSISDNGLEPETANEIEELLKKSQISKEALRRCEIS